MRHFRGPVSFPHPEKTWDGYGVVQAKFRQNSSGRPSDVAWAERAVRTELEGWASTDSGRGEAPDFVLFATNVSLSSVADTGGIDRLDRFIGKEAERLGLGLKGWAVWHRDEICRFLNLYPNVRRSYADFVTVSDVLARTLEVLPQPAVPVNMVNVMLSYAAAELVTDQWVRLGQAGAEPDNGRISLGPVAVDLKAECVGSDGPRTVLAGRHVIERGDAVLRPAHPVEEDVRHILLLGGPGQGKSTLGQLICQAYRVAFLDGGDLSPWPGGGLLNS